MRERPTHTELDLASFFFSLRTFEEIPSFFSSFPPPFLSPPSCVLLPLHAHTPVLNIKENSRACVYIFYIYLYSSFSLLFCVYTKKKPIPCSPRYVFQNYFIKNVFLSQGRIAAPQTKGNGKKNSPSWMTLVKKFILMIDLVVVVVVLARPPRRLQYFLSPRQQLLFLLLPHLVLSSCCHHHFLRHQIRPPLYFQFL